MSDFNYTDAYGSSGQKEYQSKMHDKAIEMQGRKTYVFKLDKVKTKKSEIYNEAINARVYLPHFEQRALYELNTWNNFIGTNNFVENEDNITFEYNFARLVCNIRDLKDNVSGEFFIRNKSSEILRLRIEDGKFILRTSKGVLLIDKNLEECNNMRKFCNELMEECSIIDAFYEGNAEEPKNITSIYKNLNPNERQKIDVESRLYQNCVEVITEGDIILTDKFKAYQVTGAYPTDGVVNEYIGWKCNANTIDLAQASLPDDYRKIINRNEYSMSKTRKE